jgi:hypothetical protein
MQSNRLKVDSNAKHPTPEMISKIEVALQYFIINLYELRFFISKI